MSIKVGTDIMEIERFRKTLERRPRLKEKLFTLDEVAYCESRADPAQHFAVRFCAKEAFSKALGTGVSKFSMSEVEVVRNERGKPEFALSGRAKGVAESLPAKGMDLSMSHSDFFVIAVVVIET